MSDQVLERFHRALIEEIQTRRPEYLTAPFTVAEIYQNLVPYGSHRDRIGVEMNGDYEDALLRLLVGEGGYLVLDSKPALKDMRAELERSNPNTGIYREFAAVDVRLNQAYLDLSASALDQLPDLVRELEGEDPVTVAALAPSDRSELGVMPPGVDIFEPEQEGRLGEAGPSPATRPPLSPEYVEAPTANGSEEDRGQVVSPEAVARSAECKWCRAQLPEREALNYCPYCGTDMNLVPCAACGEELEPGWRFCAGCGTEVTA